MRRACVHIKNYAHNYAVSTPNLCYTFLSSCIIQFSHRPSGLSRPRQRILWISKTPISLDWLLCFPSHLNFTTLVANLPTQHQESSSSVSVSVSEVSSSEPSVSLSSSSLSTFAMPGVWPCVCASGTIFSACDSVRFFFFLEVVGDDASPPVFIACSWPARESIECISMSPTLV